MSTHESRAIVRAEYLIATEPFQSTEETRYYLNGLLIEPHPRQGAQIVATDGHMLSCILDAEAIVFGPPQIWGLPWKATLSAPLKAAKREYKACPSVKIYADLRTGPNGLDEIRLVAAESAAEVFNGRGFVQMVRPGKIWIDGTYPEYRRVVPFEATAEKFTPATYQARYMARIAAFGQALYDAGDSAAGSATMTVFNNSIQGGPGVARFSGVPGFVVIMPVSDNQDVDIAKGGLPDWWHDTGDAESRAQMGKPKLQAVA